MKNRTLPLVVALLLSLSAPLLAQSVDEPQPATVDNPTEQAATPQSDDSADADAQTSDELPRTAGPLPLLALLGLASGASAFALRRCRR